MKKASEICCFRHHPWNRNADDACLLPAQLAAIWFGRKPCSRAMASFLASSSYHRLLPDSALETVPAAVPAILQDPLSCAHFGVSHRKSECRYQSSPCPSLPALFVHAELCVLRRQREWQWSTNMSASPSINTLRGSSPQHRIVDQRHGQQSNTSG